jgi:hypothetical protein
MAERETAEDERSVIYLESIRAYNARIKASDLISTDLTHKVPEKVDSCVVHADGFGSALSHVLPSFATILEQTFDVGKPYVQNPPKRTCGSLKASQPQGTLDVLRYEYPLIEKKKLNGIYDKLRSGVLGQDEGKESLIASLYRLAAMNEERPSAIMFYGPSGVGTLMLQKCRYARVRFHHALVRDRARLRACGDGHHGRPRDRGPRVLPARADSGQQAQVRYHVQRYHPAPQRHRA